MLFFIVLIQAEISQLERTRAAMAEEIVKLSNLNETLDEQAMLLPEYKRKLVVYHLLTLRTLVK